MSMKKAISILSTLLLFGVIFMVSQIASALFVGLLGLRGDNGGFTDCGFFTFYVISMGMTLLLVTLLEKKQYGIIKRIERKTSGFDPVSILLGVIVLIALSIVQMPLCKLLPPRDFEVGDGAFMLLTIVIIAPIFEEIIFRGRLYNMLSNKLSPVFSAVISALAFGAVHLSPIVIIEGFFAGFVFSYFYVHRRSIIAPIILHVCNNALAYALIVLSYDDESLVDILGGHDNFIFVYIASIIIVVVAATIMIARFVKEKRRTESSEDEDADVNPKTEDEE